ncbi:MATE family efflux transporter [Natronomonas halophila]|uniref:MATE family efflux transporter n=1 Tax=Natronomonas halophila TaxID=2747817 RepID=UPI0015B504F9|nr:MATE family efflux transporter [Natronomonas halophila]QLD86519.1 MATE family efflux transporter [Natronomonas halophila]
MSLVPNPVRLAILAIGLALSRVGLITEQRARRTTELAWPRVVTGIARMSKNAVDVAMVGVGVGSAAIAGVGIAGPFWGLAFSIGGGIAGGTIALVSQRFGADAYEELGLAVRSSVFLVVAATIPITAVFWTFSTELIDLLSSNDAVVRLGGDYLRIVGLGVPFAGLNLVGSRVLVGTDDSYTAMLLRAGGAVANVVINAVLIFGLGWGVEGAALGTVLSNVGVTAAFAIGLTLGRFPGAGQFPVTIDPRGSYVDSENIADLVSIGLPVMGRNLVWTVAEFPMFAILDIFGQDVVSAFVIARRIWGLMNTPGWGFGLASSSLVGQELGTGDESVAEAYGREIIRFSFAVYVASATLVFVFADPIVNLFVADPTAPEIPIATTLVRVACGAILLQGISGAAAGPLDASGDTRWTFMSQALGMFGCSIPLVYIGATTPLGIYGLYLAFIAETSIPAALNYYRFHTGKWKAKSREYRPETPADD